MFKFLKEVVAGSGSGLKDLPYTIGEPYASAWGSWTHHRGASKDDGSPVSIFSLSGSNPQDRHLVAGRNGVKRLRTVRHPNILSFLHSTEAEVPDGPAVKHTIYIVTEPVTPLSEKLKELNLGGTQRDEYFAWGLHQISKAVSFLNNDCKLVHGNVCLASVVVTQTLDWKLHAFDVLSEFDANNEASGSPMLQFEWLVGTQYKPMELTKSDWASIRKSPPWTIDSWGLGCLIYELFSGAKLTRTEDLRNTASIPKSLLPDYQRLLSSTPSRRLNPSKLINNSEFFQNKLVETIQFMEVLNLKDSVEKDSFFRKLPNIAEQLPREIVLKKLLPVLASALEFGSAAAPALTVLLKMGSWLPGDQFSTKVLPTIVKLFASNDRAIRVSLLQHIDQFGDSLAAQTVDEQVFPHVATGFSDTSAFLRELTLKSMLVLAPKLSQRTISGSLLKYLSKLQVDEEPAIRTNTTILLGNITNYMNDGTRKRVLINAFTVRALRDTFPPARAAGIMALSVTSSYYEMSPYLPYPTDFAPSAAYPTYPPPPADLPHYAPPAAAPPQPYYHYEPPPPTSPHNPAPSPYPSLDRTGSYGYGSGSGYGQELYAPKPAVGGWSDDGVYAYDGGDAPEPYGARGAAPRSSSSALFDDYGRSIGSTKERGGGGGSAASPKVVRAVPKVETSEDVRKGVQKFRVKLLPEGAGSPMDVLCQVGLDGIRMLDPNTSRTLRIYPLETVTRWDVLDSSIFAFWSKSSVDIEAKRIRLKSNSYTTNTILDTVTAATVQFKEMGGSSISRSRAIADAAKPSEQQNERKNFLGWRNLMKPMNEEKDHWVPDEAVNKCTACAGDFSAFNRRHHCRNCGDIFCDKCTQGRTPLTTDADAQPVRVCDKCMAEVSQRLNNAREAANRPIVHSHEDLAKKLQEAMDINKKSSSASRSSDGSGKQMREVACPICTVHLQVQVPTSGSETIECGVCQHPFLVSAR